MTATIPLLSSVEAFLAGPLSLRIGGHRLDGDGEFDVVDPSTGGHLCTVARAGEREVDLAVAAARRAFDGAWSALTADERSKLLWRLAELIDERAEVFGQLDALDNGKPFAVARDVDAAYSARHFRYFAGWPSKIEGATIPVSEPDRLNYTKIEPVGVCGLIAPWNYPLLMAAWKLAPALAAGNCVVLKPAEQTPLSALYLADLALEAGFPEGVLNVVPGFGTEAGAALAAHPGVDKVGFTGSTATGRRIVEASMGNLKKVSLELGGKAANIVFADADLEKAIPGAFWALFGNNGQSCTAGARLYVHSSIHDRVLEGLIGLAAKLSVGPGMAADGHDLGPVISERQMRTVTGYIDSGVSEGAECVAGGGRLGKEGFFVAPTVLTNVADDMRIAREEIFGPVLCVLSFDDEDDVLARANDTDYGLAAGLWTQDVTRARTMASRLKAGTIWINCWGETDAASPFGGMKQSGYGREMGKDAIALYSQTKSVWLA
ncbi:aldehyde dehydrogenase family protein [Hoeflea sp. TYP-13]|uniref:aldehyde dehydrogenase family protein n=1 Tax=Hoeflea sp. TYP-13 TaxID=3230023 RepID=UPI0034C5DE8A